MRLLPALSVAPLVSAYVIPNINLQQYFTFESSPKEIAPKDPTYDDLPIVDSQSLQDLITLEDLNSSAVHLFELAQTSVGRFEHPTRVIASPGHWKTIDWIKDSLKPYSDYFNVYTQDFNALDGHVFNHSLKINNVKYESKPFSLTPAAHVYNSFVAFADGYGCNPWDYANNTWAGVAIAKRGECSFGTKSAIAGQVGFRALLIYDADAQHEDDIINGTLGPPEPTTIGTLGVSKRTVNKILSLFKNGIPVKVDLFIAAFTGYIKTTNVIAETIHGDHDNVIALGAHSDSVAAGPGINDDGSGTISLLNVAKQLTNFKINNAVRFAWWSAEEEGLLGSNYYATNLTPEENSKIRLFMDYDMMASPNFEYQIYNGSNEVNPKGSEEIKNLYIDYYESKGLDWTLIPFDGRSDYVGFIEHGIPGGGVAAGAEGLNSINGQVLDKCYHESCDDLTNIAWDAFLVNTKLIAHSVATYANSLDGFPIRETKDVTSSSTSDYKYRGGHLII